MARLTWNDLQNKPWSYAIAAATDITSGIPLRILGISIHAGASNGEVIVYNNTAASGSANIRVGALANESYALTFGLPGVRYGTGLSIGTNGTPDSIGVYYIMEGSA